MANMDQSKIELISVYKANQALSEMVALFRVELRSFKGIVSKPNVDAGREEMEEYLAAGFPVFAAVIDGQYAGYVVCRVIARLCGWSPSLSKRNTAVMVLLLLYIARQKKSPLLMGMIPFTTMFIPTITA